jgi:hypothetical protein
MRRSFFIVLPVDCWLIIWYIFLKMLERTAIIPTGRERLFSGF